MEIPRRGWTEADLAAINAQLRRRGVRNPNGDFVPCGKHHWIIEFGGVAFTLAIQSPDADGSGGMWSLSVWSRERHAVGDGESFSTVRAALDRLALLMGCGPGLPASSCWRCGRPSCDAPMEAGADGKNRMCPYCGNQWRAREQMDESVRWQRRRAGKSIVAAMVNTTFGAHPRRRAAVVLGLLLAAAVLGCGSRKVAAVPDFATRLAAAKEIERSYDEAYKTADADYLRFKLQLESFERALVATGGKGGPEMDASREALQKLDDRRWELKRKRVDAAETVARLSRIALDRE